MSAIDNAAALVVDVEHRIATGDLEPGSRLEPIRSLAKSLALAPNTVASAYRTLRERGLTIGRGRSGTFVADRPTVGNAISERVPDGVVDLASGHPDSALLPDLGEAMRRIEYGGATYSTSSIDPDLAAVFSVEFEHDGIDSAHLAAVGGALDGLERVLEAHLRPGDAVAVEDPAYAAVLDLLRAMQLEPVPVVIDAAGPVPAAVDEALLRGCAALVVTPRAQNPTGAAIDHSRSSELRTVLHRHPDTLVVEDDHAGRVAGAAHVPLVGTSLHWAVIRSASKSFGPDLRVAVVAGDEMTIARVTGRQSVGTGWVSHLLQRLVVHLMSEQSDLLETAEATYRHRRSLALNELAARGVAATGVSGLNIWVPVPDEAAVVTGLLQHGYAVRAGARFRIDAPPAVRITVASCDDAQIVEMAQVLAELLAGKTARRTA